METLFQNILTASFHGSIVIAAVILLRLVLKKTPRKYICMLWLLAGLRLLLPFPIQSELSLQPDVSSVTEVRQQIAAPRQEIIPSAPAAAEVPEAQPEQAVYTPAPVQEIPVSIPQPEITPTATPEAAPDYLALVPWLWFGIACCFGIYSLCSYLSLQRKVRTAIKIPGGWESDRIETAFILGFIRPKIYIPMGMSPKTQRYILAHERTHLEKGDHWFKMIGFVALALHWFNPLVWVAYILLCKDIEIACDERVVQFMELEERKEYSAALLNCSTNRAHFAACPVAFGEVSVKERIKSVLSYKKPGFWISLVGVIAIVFVAVCLVTSPAKEGAEQSAAGETTPVLTEEQKVLKKCADALDTMLTQDSYALNVTGENEYIQWQTDLCRQGENTLWRYLPSSSPDPTSGRMEYGGRHYAFQSGGWVETDEADTEFEAYLDRFRWDLDKATLLTQTSENDWEQIQLTTQWQTDSGTVETATHTYFFDADGSLAYIRVTNAPNTNVISVTLSPWLTMLDKTAEDYFEEAAAAITDGSVTAADLASQAEFDEWGVNFRVDDDRLSDSGSDVYISQSEIGKGALSTSDEYWLERKVGNTWEVVTPVNQPKWSNSGVGIPKGSSTYGYLDWTPIYGKLPTGTYRMGKNIHCYDETDRYSNTHAFYSEFEIYSVVDSNSPEAAAAVERCYTALDALKNRQSIHWLSVAGSNSTTEKWLDGENSLQIRDWMPGVDPQTLSEHEREIAPRTDTWVQYNGVSYGDVREAPEVLVSKVLGLGVRSLSTSMDWNRFADDFNLSFFERSNHQISFPEGVGVVSDEMVRFVMTWKNAGDETLYTSQLTYRFDESGNLVYMEYLPTYDENPQSFYIQIYDDSAAEIDAKIKSYTENLYVSGFSWEQAKAKYATDEFNHRDNSFVNNNTSPVTNPVDAARRALKEYPNLKDYLSLDVAHDDAAGMWRVTVKSYYSYQASDEYRDIYLDDNGITHLLVYEGPIEYDQSRK